ncbi:MAG: heavy-metal-associated domain-containing protein [Pseudonocardiales bacterium]|nr:heavy-metal-associated domain-containing protein [Pseudonocardiales bacterium]MBV9032531.1 heavy-metal-associated domain-containing protein [Pseudonocardiales bacterium]MBW0008777.1 heavy-metal-associated domain-containing protein [Pseudonocardiales bacterium]
MGDTATISEYIVTGMVCQHCVSAVTREVGAIEGVTDVLVDLATGRVTITSDRPLDDVAVRAAIDEAGYESSAESSG